MNLTVLVPVYNIAEHLPRFFESMAKQTYTDYRLVVIDDGSEDDSLAVCRRYAEKDDRIRVIPKEHMGIAGIRNAGMAYIDTEFTAYADGDDYVEPDYLKHLMDARDKYDADLAISRVQYHLENGAVEGAFRARGELLIRREDFPEKIPVILDDRRLNYLYGKVYRSSLLKDIRVEDDVRQGSDTMINFRFLAKAASVVLIDDLDYHYIRYNSRSVTSYKGEGAYLRIQRINRDVYDCSESMGILTDEMLAVIDARNLQSAVWVIDKIVASDSDDDTKARQIGEILNDGFYRASYERQKKRDAALDFEVIAPQDGAAYLKKRQRHTDAQQRKARILGHTPGFIVNVYHKIKGGSSEE